MTHKCTQALDRGKEVSTVFFDISKAFDSVPHLPLLMKLAVINVDPCIRKWVQSYLSGREQYVAVNGAKSPILPVICGVPQGSVPVHNTFYAAR